MTLEELIDAVKKAGLVSTDAAEAMRAELEELREIAEDEGRGVYLTPEQRAALQNDANRVASARLDLIHRFAKGDRLTFGDMRGTVEDVKHGAVPGATVLLIKPDEPQPPR